MKPTRQIAVLMMVLLSITAIACHKKPDPVPIPSSTATTTQTGMNQDSLRRAQEAARLAAEQAAVRRAADSIANANRLAGDAAGAANAMRATLTTPVHFAYDMADLRVEDRAILDAKVPILRANPNVSIRIGGHTDERGSDEYNLALGQRRAAAAKGYLVDHGIPEARIETISYGEERPIAQGSDEGAFAQNRRAEFEITGGGQTLRRP